LSDQLPTVWDITAHTLAKHQILNTYLNAWLPIMSRQAKRVGVSPTRLLFVDGFAGPGLYTRGEEGSPVLAVKAALSHIHDFYVPIRFLFIEKDKDRCDTLRKTLAQYDSQIRKSSRIDGYDVKNGDCEAILREYLDELQDRGEKLGPALLFLDQFGFSDVSMELVAAIMANPLCEVFSYLNWDHMNRFLSDKSKWDGVTRAFGGTEWKEVFEFETNKRAAFMLNTYKTALRERACSEYVWNFAMSDEHERLLYWLIFCTNNLRGLEEMKRAMWSVDPSGGFRFSDNDDPQQLSLFQSCTEEILAGEISEGLSGQVLSAERVKEFVLTETPAYNFKKALKILEDSGRLEIVSAPYKRRRGTFPDDRLAETRLRVI
jgi:three-Cys-motif partner protein